MCGDNNTNTNNNNITIIIIKWAILSNEQDELGDNGADYKAQGDLVRQNIARTTCRHADPLDTNGIQFQQPTTLMYYKQPL